jgi:hypothetical protein
MQNYYVYLVLQDIGLTKVEMVKDCVGKYTSAFLRRPLYRMYADESDCVLDFVLCRGFKPSSSLKCILNGAVSHALPRMHLVF